MLGVRSEEDVVHLGGEVVEDVAWSWCGGGGIIRHWEGLFGVGVMGIWVEEKE